VYDVTSLCLKALGPASHIASDRESMIGQPVPRGQRCQFCFTRQKKTGRYFAHELSADFTNKVIATTSTSHSYFC